MSSPHSDWIFEPDDARGPAGYPPHRRPSGGQRWLIPILASTITFVLGLGIGLVSAGRLVGAAPAASQPAAVPSSAEPAPAASTSSASDTSESTSSQSSEAESTQSESTQSQPESTESESTQSESTEPESTESESTQSESTEPKKAHRVSKREWAKVMKDPDSYVGDRFIIYGEVTQFDSATGKDALLADTAYKNTTDSGYFDGENTALQGSEDLLSDVVEDDVFKATVTVLGSYSYDTQVGGNTTVPKLQIDKISVIGNNE